MLIKPSIWGLKQKNLQSRLVGHYRRLRPAWATESRTWASDIIRICMCQKISTNLFLNDFLKGQLASLTLVSNPHIPPFHRFSLIYQEETREERKETADIKSQKQGERLTEVVITPNRNWPALSLRAGRGPLPALPASLSPNSFAQYFSQPPLP